MKSIAISIFVCALLMNSYMSAGQSFTWAKSCNDSGYIAASKIAVDGWGNSYVTGYCNSTVTIGGSTIVPGFASTAYCLIKYDSTGNVIWARSGGGSHNNGGNDVCADASGNVYVTGYFHNAITFGSITLTAADTDFISNDLFVVKYDSSGTPLWAKQATGPCQVVNSALFADAAGNVYITGQFNDSMIFDTTILSGSAQYFLVKYDLSGNVKWATQSTGSGYADGAGVCADNAGNVYITGGFGYGEFFGTVFLPGIGDGNVFVAKYNSAGNMVWVKQAGGIGASDVTASSGICTDGSENIYITGGITDSINFGTIKLTATGSDLLFIAKYDSSGNVAWAKAPAGSANMASSGAGIVMDNTGALLVTGYYSGTIKFDTTASMTCAGGAGGQSDVFVAKYNSSGSGLWAISAGGTGTDLATGIATNGNAISISGKFDAGAATFGSLTINNPVSYPISFIAHLTDAVSVPQAGINNIFQTRDDILVYPNPASEMLYIQMANHGGSNNYVLCNITGQTVMSGILTSPVDVSSIPDGLYVLKITGYDTVVAKMVSVSH